MGFLCYTKKKRSEVMAALKYWMISMQKQRRGSKTAVVGGMVLGVVFAQRLRHDSRNFSPLREKYADQKKYRSLPCKRQGVQLFTLREQELLCPKAVDQHPGAVQICLI
jgi:hypothetical protein